MGTQPATALTTTSQMQVSHGSGPASSQILLQLALISVDIEDQSSDVNKKRSPWKPWCNVLSIILLQICVLQS